MNPLALRRPRHPLHRRRGLTFIEAIFASVLLAMGALAALAGITTAWQHQQIALEEAAAIQLAEGTLERVTAKPYRRDYNATVSRAPADADWANEMDGYEEDVEILPGAANFQVKLLIDESVFGGSTIGRATVVVDTPSGQQFRLRRLLPTVDDPIAP